MIIRGEQPGDIAAIYAVTQAAFAPMPFSSGTEGPIIERLREDGDLTISLVADDAGEIVGHVAFSPVSIAGEVDRLYGLGPVCAEPSRKNSGIGTMLIKEGLSRLRALDAKACVLVGDPNYYARFGFVGDSGLTHGSVPSPAVQGLWLDGRPRVGEIVYAPGFRR